MVWFWFYQAISNTLQMGKQRVHKTSENLHILTRLSAGEHCIELRWFVLCNKNQLDAYLSSVYFVNQPLHVSGIFVAHRVGLANRRSTNKHNTCQLLYIYSIPPCDGLQICPKHVEVDWRNKLRINSASSWFLSHRCIEMHGEKKHKIICWFLLILRRQQSFLCTTLNGRSL